MRRWARLWTVVRWIIILPGLPSFSAFGQTGQLDITRVQLMPNMPSPYAMRDWKTVAFRYDSIIYSLNATGTYLPVMSLRPSGINYPSIQPILLDSYVGSSSHGSQAEAINIIPSLVSASLIGIDKSNQAGINWVEKAKDFFNKANGQNVYLNGESATSGSDWWYDVMPNVFFYQLYSKYPNTTDFPYQFTTVTDRWLAAVKAMGGKTTPWTIPQMNYRGFNLATMTPNASGVAEPEAAGSIAWLLYNAWLKTGNHKYLEGSQMAIEFLNGLSSNPAYEIQLPYGTFVAARMNAELGTQYDIQKMINWSFDQSSLRNWGTIVGSWGDGSNIDVSGLVGEIDNPATGYAFTMNGYEQASELVPLVKYDKRFARTVAKWTLNLANASRLFYSQYEAPDHQDDFDWASTYDPHAAIAYEALKQTWNGVNLVATGDAKRNGWAQTNLGLYGSSHVGYLASLITTTDVDGILLLDVNKTDFFGKNTFPSFLVYNPYPGTKQITLPLGSQTYDIYDAISETIILPSATGNVMLSLPANEAKLLVYVPPSASTTASNGKLYIGTDIVDYHYGNDFTGKLRIKSMGVTDTLVAFDQSVPVYSEIDNASGSATYNWYVNGALASTSATKAFTWPVPSVAGNYSVRLEVIDGPSSDRDSIQFKVVSHIPVPPSILSVVTDSLFYYAGSTATVVCHTTNADGGTLKFVWTIPAGSIASQSDSILHWNVPAIEGLWTVSCQVKNADSLTATATKDVLVKVKSQGTTDPFAYYPFDGDTRDYSGNRRDAVLQGPHLTDDPRGQPNKAYHFASGADIIYVPYDPAFDFSDRITISFWVQLDALTQESYIISHGSYEERWKVSVVTPTNKLRWTVKTSSATKDLDSSVPLALNHYYHVAVVYTGYSMELYLDGVMNNYTALSGPIQFTLKPLTMGRKDQIETNYSLHGSLDEVRIYDASLEPSEVAILKTLWNTVTGFETSEAVSLYPNPAGQVVFVRGIGEPPVRITALDMAGRPVPVGWSYEQEQDLLSVDFDRRNREMLVLKIETAKGSIFKKVVVGQ